MRRVAHDPRNLCQFNRAHLAMNGALLLCMVFLLSQGVNAFKKLMVFRSSRMLMATAAEFDLKT
jgi:hypothetical protein